MSRKPFRHSRQGRKFKSPYKVKRLKFNNSKEKYEIWKNYCSIPEYANNIGRTPQTVRNWIRKRKVEAFLYEGIIILKKLK